MLGIQPTRGTFNHQKKLEKIRVAQRAEWKLVYPEMKSARYIAI